MTDLNPTEKRCPDCRITKPRADFNRNRRQPDGLQSYCRVCQCARIKAWAANRRYQKAHPEIARAHHAANYAVRTGKLTRPTECEECAEPGEIHAHHPDYSQPLDVEWLCAACHREVHKGGEKP